MSNSQYDHDEVLLFPDAYQALCNHFSSIETFRTEYRRIVEPLERVRFLKLASLYKNLVKAGKFIVSSETLPSSDLNYYDTTYRFIALVAIIEAVVGKVEWMEFYEWLNKNKKYVIKDKSELEQLYKQYISEFGATKNIVKFFESLENDEQEFLKSKVFLLHNAKGKMIKKESDIRDIASLLYDLRSQFMHGAIITVALGEIASVTNGKMQKRKSFTSTLSLNQLMKVFERGFIRYFGLQAEREVLLF